jgi:hypothetical protein
MENVMYDGLIEGMRFTNKPCPVLPSPGKAVEMAGELPADPYFNRMDRVEAMALVVEDCSSLKGTKFSLRKGKEVMIEKQIIGQPYVQVRFRDLVGIFRKSHFALS